MILIVWLVTRFINQRQRDRAQVTVNPWVIQILAMFILWTAVKYLYKKDCYKYEDWDKGSYSTFQLLFKIELPPWLAWPVPTALSHLMSQYMVMKWRSHLQPILSQGAQSNTHSNIMTYHYSTIPVALSIQQTPSYTCISFSDLMRHSYNYVILLCE